MRLNCLLINYTPRLSLAYFSSHFAHESSMVYHYQPQNRRPLPYSRCYFRLQKNAGLYASATATAGPHGSAVERAALTVRTAKSEATVFGQILEISAPSLHGFRCHAQPA